ncbi:hypothetical protein V6N13_083076 [Hibiscus sabdariffa]
MALPLHSTAIRCFHGGRFLLPLFGSPSDVASSSILATVNSWHGRFYFCFQNAFHIRIDCEVDLRAQNSKLQYGDWLRYIPPKKQELHNRSKGSIRYLDGANSAKNETAATGTSSISTEATNTVDVAETTKGPVIPVAVIDPSIALGPIGTNSTISIMLAVASEPIVDTNSTMDTKLATGSDLIGSTMPNDAITQVASKIPFKGHINVLMVAILNSPSTEPFGSTMIPIPTSLGGPEGFIDFLNNPNETPTKVPYLLDNVGLDVAPTTLLPLPWEGGIDYELATIDEDTPLLISRGAKR